MRTGQRVAGLCRDLVDAAVAHPFQITVHTLVVGGKKRIFQQTGTTICSIRRQHGEIGCPLQDSDKGAELLGALLQKFCCRHLGRCVVVLGHVIVVVDAGGKGCCDTAANTTCHEILFNSFGHHNSKHFNYLVSSDSSPEVNAGFCFSNGFFFSSSLAYGK